MDDLRPWLPLIKALQGKMQQKHDAEGMDVLPAFATHDDLEAINVESQVTEVGGKGAIDDI
jgi:hypothetical protein